MKISGFNVNADISFFSYKIEISTFKIEISVFQLQIHVSVYMYLFLRIKTLFKTQIYLSEIQISLF